jgi:hypothetical protein
MFRKVAIVKGLAMQIDPWRACFHAASFERD